MSLDDQLFLAVQQLTGNSVVDQVMVYAAELLVLLVPLSLVYLWFRGSEGKEDSLYAFAVAVVGLAASYSLGLLYYHESPFMVYDTIASGAPENGFPSQHTAVILSTAFGYYLRDRLSIGHIVLAAGILTGVARIYIGEHFPLDILGSFVASGIGVALIWLVQSEVERVVQALAERVQGIEDWVNDRLFPARWF